MNEQYRVGIVVTKYFYLKCTRPDSSCTQTDIRVFVRSERGSSNFTCLTSVTRTSPMLIIHYFINASAGWPLPRSTRMCESVRENSASLVFPRHSTCSGRCVTPAQARLPPLCLSFTLDCFFPAAFFPHAVD